MYKILKLSSHQTNNVFATYSDLRLQQWLSWYTYWGNPIRKWWSHWWYWHERSWDGPPSERVKKMKLSWTTQSERLRQQIVVMTKCRFWVRSFTLKFKKLLMWRSQHSLEPKHKKEAREGGQRKKIGLCRGIRSPSAPRIASFCTPSGYI
jgi:hypothetical protein